MTRERFEVIQREFEHAIKFQAVFGGIEAPLLLWGETIKALEEAWRKLDAWVLCGLTEEMLRDHEGYLKLNRGVVMVSEHYLEKLQAECDAAIGQRDERALRAARLKDQMEYFRKGHDRYDTARRLSPAQWADAWKLNISTGKPFDEIIDDLRPFVRPNDPLTGHIAANAAEGEGE